MNKPFGYLEIDRATKKDLEATDWSVSDVLVGSVRSELQVKENIRMRFYYAPEKNMPDNSEDAKYVALYQSSLREQPGIRFYGKIISRRKMKRSEINVPLSKNNGDETYVVFDIEKWYTLQNDICNGTDYVGKPRMTNLFLLKNCNEIYGLFYVHSAFDFTLMYALESLLIPSGEERVIKLDKCVLLSVNGRLTAIDNKGNLLGSFDISAYSGKQRLVFEKLQTIIKMKKMPMTSGK